MAKAKADRPNAEGHLRDAISFSREAIAALPPDDKRDVANARFNHAEAHRRLPHATAGELRLAVEECLKVLRIYRRDVSQTEWAQTHLEQALAREKLAKLRGEDAPGLLERAIASVKAARTIYPAKQRYRRLLERLRRRYEAVRTREHPLFSAIRPAE